MSQHARVPSPSLDIDIERYYSRNRRTAVSAESTNPVSASSSKVVVPKPQEIITRIKRCAKNTMIFQALDDEQLQDIADAMIEVQISLGDKVIQQGDEGDFFYIVDIGEFEFIVDSKVVGTTGPSGSFGELALMYNCPRAATVKAKTAGKVWALDRKTFRNIVIQSHNQQRNKYEKFLENIPILEPLSRSQRFRVVDSMEELFFEAGDYIIKQGDKGDAFYILKEGVATVFRNPSEGEPIIELKRLDPGDYFGEIALLTDKPRAANVQARSARTRVLRVSSETFTRQMGPCEDILRSNIMHYKRIYETFLEEVAILSSLTSFERQRVAEYLQPMSYNANDHVITQGEAGDRFYIIEQGTAVAIQTPPNGGVAIQVMVYNKGDYFGEIALLTDAPRAASIIASTPLVCVTLNREKFIELLGPIGEIMKRNMAHYKAYEKILKEMESRKVESADEAFLSPPNIFRERKRRTAVSAPSIDTTADVSKKMPPKSRELAERIQKIIKSNILFSHLDDRQISELINSMTEKRVTPGDYVIKQFEMGDNYYIVEEGHYDIFVSKDRSSEPRKVTQVGPAGSFGELALMYNCPRAASVQAVTGGLLWALDAVSFRTILMDSNSKQRTLYQQFLNQVPILEPLSEAERYRVADSLEPMTFRDSELIIREGEMGDAFYILESGEAVVYKTPHNPTHSLVELRRLKRGDYFGEIALLTNKPRAANVMSYGDTRVLRLESDAFTRLLGPCEELLHKNIEHYRRLYETFLEQVPLLAPLTKPEIRRIADALVPVSYEDGQVIILQGEHGDKFYILEEGEAYPTRSPAPGVGAKRLNHTYTKGDYFGEVALITNSIRRASIIAQGQVKCLTLDRSRFVELLGPLEEILKRNMEFYNTFEDELEVELKQNMGVSLSSASVLPPIKGPRSPLPPGSPEHSPTAPPVMSNSHNLGHHAHNQQPVATSLSHKVLTPLSTHYQAATSATNLSPLAHPSSTSLHSPSGATVLAPIARPPSPRASLERPSSPRSGPAQGPTSGSRPGSASLEARLARSGSASSLHSGAANPDPRPPSPRLPSSPTSPASPTSPVSPAAQATVRRLSRGGSGRELAPRKSEEALVPNDSTVRSKACVIV
eukprot:TRINITY_DN7130_c0_g1_i1.p2 TRINITY_DN7130_c0_g1~~TRINITY_DN7130_c0_g1_i1.p2  ORF type:complete len:1117 (+),score=203.68 TRINITY_DN7130_c0_g1_i1:4043-7393(+)